eukprot:2131269-Rhodomonas_salina.2
MARMAATHSTQTDRQTDRQTDTRAATGWESSWGLRALGRKRRSRSGARHASSTGSKPPPLPPPRLLPPCIPAPLATPPPRARIRTPRQHERMGRGSLTAARLRWGASLAPLGGSVMLHAELCGVYCCAFRTKCGPRRQKTWRTALGADITLCVFVSVMGVFVCVCHASDN